MDRQPVESADCASDGESHLAVSFRQGPGEHTERFRYSRAAPSHPELLDWLATEFVANGWSMKKLHRQILLSSVYRQSTRSFEPRLRSATRRTSCCRI